MPLSAFSHTNTHTTKRTPPPPLPALAPMAPVRILTTDDIQPYLEPKAIVQAVREAYHERGHGAPARPRTRLKNDDPAGLLTGYTAILPHAGAMGGYTYSAGFQTKDAWFLAPLFSTETGELKALIDGSKLNPLKTGAASAVAVDELARQDATTLALIGSGRQAYGQFRCIETVRELTHVTVHSPTPKHRTALAETIQNDHGIPATPTHTSQEAIQGADIVVTATRSGSPVFNGEDLDDGAHVTAMGQYHPKRREVDGLTVARSTYVVDLRERVTKDSGEFLLAQAEGLVGPDHVHAELGAVVAGVAPGRRRPEEVTLFDSGGTGIETVGAAQYVFEQAKNEDRGEVVSFRSAGEAMPRAW